MQNWNLMPGQYLSPDRLNFMKATIGVIRGEGAVILIKALLKEKAARCFTLLAKICLVFLSSKSENAQMFSFFCS